MLHLARLLLAGYGLAAVLGVAAAQAGAGLLVAGLIFWVGGAVAVAGLAVLVAPLLGSRPATTAADEADLAEALRQWEEDRRDDRAAAAIRRDGASAG